MKAITCEMCGGNELLKVDGLYVCQHCGTKYTPEEAKKLLSAGIVDVKVDETDKLQNLYIIARRALDATNYEEAYEHYKEIQKLDPNNWEPRMYVPALYIINAKKFGQALVGNLKQLQVELSDIFDTLLTQPDLEETADRVDTVLFESAINANSIIYDYSWEDDTDITLLNDSFCSNLQIAEHLGEFLTENFPKDSSLSKSGVGLWKWVLTAGCSPKYISIDKKSFYAILENIKKFEPEYTATHKDDIKVTTAVPQPKVEKQESIFMSWKFIIPMLIVFWPVGLIFMIVKIVRK